MSFAAGFGAGMGAGIATGMSSGRNSVREEVEKNLRMFVETHTIAIRDQSGREVPVDEFLRVVLKESPRPKRKVALWISVAIGVLLFLLTAALVGFLVMGG